MMKKNILYIGNFEFPFGNAAGKRVYANGKILRELGYNVIFIGMGKESDKNLISSKKKFDGFTYYNFEYPKNHLQWIDFISRFLKLKQLLKIEGLVNDLAIVITYGSPSLSVFNALLTKFCKKQKISIIADCVDWLTVKTNNPIFNVIKGIDNNFQKAYLNKKMDGVIAISSYLSNYYIKFGKRTVIIPPLSPNMQNDLALISKRNEKLIITYAGIPFRKGQVIKDLNTLKDRIDKTIFWLYQSKLKGHDFIFNIYGFTKEEYLYSIPAQKKYINVLEDNIIFHGRVSNDIVTEKVSLSDFTILIRDVNRDTTAGFPTKISESISCGTPVITTKTSDLASYITEGENGFFILNEESEYITAFFDKIFALNKEQIRDMKRHCLKSNLFYYKQYLNEMNNFIKYVKK